MISSRTRKLLDLVKSSDATPDPETNLLFLPKYETTKGSLSADQQRALEGVSSVNKEPEYIESNIESEDKTSGSEYIPSTSSSKITEPSGNKHDFKGPLKSKSKKRKKRQRKRKDKSQQNIIILQNVVLKEAEQMRNNKTSDKTTESKERIISSHEKEISEQNSIAPDKKFIMSKYLDSVNHTSVGNNEQNESFLGGQESENRDFAQGVSTGIGEETRNGSEESDDPFKITYRKNKPVNTIQVTAASKKNGKRIRDKIHVCYFCEKSIIHMARHFETVHKEDIEVAKCLAYPKNSEQRRKGYLELIRVGDFYHNCNVLSTKTGELVLIRRPSQDEVKFVKNVDYGPCPNCLGFSLKKHLWHHIKYTCKEKINCEEYSDSKHVIAESNALIYDVFGYGFTQDFYESIVNNFQSDEIGDIAKSDLLILKFGSMQFEKYGKTQNELIRQNMRQLGRLTIALKKLDKNNSQSLSDFLTPDKFDMVIQATKEISMTTLSNETFRPEFKIPSLALKVGYALKKCISIERGTALRAGNIKRSKSLSSFLELMNMEWNIRISSNALATLYKRKLNAAQLLPITQDLVILSNHIDANILSTKREMESNKRTNKTWTRLATLALSRIILFNKRRSGEAARMKLSDYINRPMWEDQNTEEIKESLTPIERKLAETLIMVEIEGKRGRKVPVILTPIIKESIDLLIRHRDECRIYLHNKYIFARSNQSLSYLRGHDCLRKICEEVKLENPLVITGTKLRKYIATVCQLFNMSENEYDWLARHLGHDIKVHREFYRLHESAVELTKISRLLMAVDTGQASKFAGKRIEEIAMKDLPCLEDEVDDIEPESDDDKDSEKEPETEEEIIRGKVANKSSLIKDTPVKKKNRTLSKRVLWTSEEKSAVLDFFKINIKKDIVPKQAQCLECISANQDVLKRRNWKDVKNCVYNEIKARKRISTK